ncbi:FAD-dependent monooxygenase DEP4 [Paramyrothecium foliicola]|nr:FAD-dependent monooxygenase DEP4 [Paramyrothecium foliicola]
MGKFSPFLVLEGDKNRFQRAVKTRSGRTRIKCWERKPIMETADCVVIGTGWYGLAAAKQFRCLNPYSSLVIFEREASIGGTWADHRIYPGVKSNNLLSGYEYPDYPMEEEKFGVKPNQHIPGSVLNAYLKSYAAHFGIAELVRFNSDVAVAEHMDTEEGGWELTVVDAKSQQQSRVFARRLIIATGQTSEAFLPHFAGQETFGGKIFHGKDFLKNRDTIKEGSSVTVFGGTKLAWDAVYAYATAGVKVVWVIRYTRFLSWFSPCIWGDADGYSSVRNFLHGTALGRGLVNFFWKMLASDSLALCNYDAHPKTAKLKPWTEAMLTGTSFSIINYDTNIWDLIKSDLVEIHIGEIDHLSPGKVHLADGTELESHALLANTGWKHVPRLKFLPEGIEQEMGVPHTPPQKASVVDLASQKLLVDKADAEILERFPRLKQQSIWNEHYVPMTEQKGIDSNDEITPYKPLTPYMLYRFMIPASERFLRPRDTAFVGAVSSFSNPINAHIQGLWISAYFNGKLSNDPSVAVGDVKAMSQLQYQTILYNRFGKWRYPTEWGSNKVPGFIFDAVPYLDLLQNDLGLKPHRKGGFWTELWSPYLPKDYRSINDDWENSIS